jgi:hypothetical protein
VQKAGNKILILFFVLTTVLTIDGLEFLHNHHSSSENNCLSCVFSSSLIAVDNDTSDGNEINIIPEFSFLIPTISIQTDYSPTSVSDRAPPID